MSIRRPRPPASFALEPGRRLLAIRIPVFLRTLQTDPAPSCQRRRYAVSAREQRHPAYAPTASPLRRFGRLLLDPTERHSDVRRKLIGFRDLQMVLMVRGRGVTIASIILLSMGVSKPFTRS